MYNIKSDNDYEEQLIDHDRYDNSSGDDTAVYEDDEYDEDSPDDIEIDVSSEISSLDLSDGNVFVISNGVTEINVQIQTNNANSEDDIQSGSDDNDVIELSDSDSDQSTSTDSVRSETDDCSDDSDV